MLDLLFSRTKKNLTNNGVALKRYFQGKVLQIIN